MQALGINLGYLLVQIIAFIVIYTFLTRWVYNPLNKTLRERRERIAKGLEDAHAAEQARANAERDAQRLIDQRRAEANKLLEEGRIRGEEQARAVVADAQREAETIRSKARADAEEERNVLLGEVRSQVAQLAIAAAERLIQQSLDEKKSHSVIADFFAKPAVSIESPGATVEVTSALPLTDAEKKQLTTLTNAKEITYRVDPSILGGLILRSGDRVVDASVRNNLQTLAVQMR